MTPLLAPRLRSDRGFERIYRRHVRDVYRYALAMLRNPADAEDVTQTTFLNAYRAYQRGERPREPQNWLIAIAHNVCRQRFRQSERRVQEVMYDDNVAEAVAQDRDEAPTLQDIQRALGHLAFNQRAALVMRELEGRSYSEIAEMLDVSVGAVETLIFRARRTLREQLEGTLTCREAERAISRQLDGRLPNTERASLRAHLRECKECGTLARKLRAQSAAIKALGLVPLPSSLSSLASLLGHGGTAAGSGAAGGLALKIAAVAATGSVAAGVGYQAVSPLPWQAKKASPQAARAAPAVAAAGVGAALTPNQAGDRVSEQSPVARPEPRLGTRGKEAAKGEKQIPAKASIKFSKAAKGDPAAAASSKAFPSEKPHGPVAKASAETKPKKESKWKGGTDELASYGKGADGAKSQRPPKSNSSRRGRKEATAPAGGNGPSHTPSGRAADKDQAKRKDVEKGAKLPQAPLIDKGKQDLDQFDDSPEHASAAEHPTSQTPAGTPGQPTPPGQENKDKDKDKEDDKEKDKGKDKGK